MNCPSILWSYRWLIGLRKRRPWALFGPQGQEYFEACLKSLSIRRMFLREKNFFVGELFVVRVLGDVGCKEQLVGLRVDGQEGEVEERMQIGAEQESIFDVVVFGAAVRVDMGGFEDLFDLAT